MYPLTFKLFRTSQKAGSLPLVRHLGPRALSLIEFSDPSLFGLGPIDDGQFQNLMEHIDFKRCSQVLLLNRHMLKLIESSLRNHGYWFDIAFEQTLPQDAQKKLDSIQESLRKLRSNGIAEHSSLFQQTMETLATFLYDTTSDGNGVAGIEVGSQGVIQVYSNGCVHAPGINDILFLDTLLSQM